MRFLFGYCCSLQLAALCWQCVQCNQFIFPPHFHRVQPPTCRVPNCCNFLCSCCLKLQTWNQSFKPWHYSIEELVVMELYNYPHVLYRSLYSTYIPYFALIRLYVAFPRQFCNLHQSYRAGSSEVKASSAFHSWVPGSQIFVSNWITCGVYLGMWSCDLHVLYVTTIIMKVRDDKF